MSASTRAPANAPMYAGEPDAGDDR
jgi:hypothetical protein